MALNCTEAVRKALGGEPLSKELEAEMAKEVKRLIKKHADLGKANVVDGVMDDLAASADELEIAKRVKRRNAALNARKKIEGIQYIRNVWGDNPIDGLRAMLRSHATPRFNAGNSVARAQVARADFYIASLYTELAKKKLWKVFTKGDMDVDIHRAMWQLDSEAPDMAGIPRDAVVIAKEIKKINEYTRQQANRHGAAIGTLDGYVSSRSTDGAKVSTKREEWVQFMEENLDFTKTFADVTDPVKIRKLLEEMRTEFIASSHIAFDKPPSTSALGGFGNVAKGLSHKRVLHFKTPEAEAGYAVEFGSGNLSKNVMFHLDRMGADTAIMEHLGPNAKGNLDAIFDAVRKDLKRAQDDKTLAKLNTYQSFVDNDLWKHIDGTSRAIENAPVARASSIMVAIQQTSSLGSALLSMVSDIGFVAAEADYQGQNFLGSMGNSVKSLVSGLPTGEKRQVLTSLSVLSDGIRGSVIERFSSGDLLPGKVAGGVQQFFKWTGIQFWPDRLRDGFVLSMSNHIANNTKHKFAALPMEMQRTLKLSGFDENTWDNVLRQATRKADGLDYFSPETLDDIPDDAFNSVLTNQGVKPTAARVTALKQELGEKIRTMFQNRAINAVIEGDVQTRATLVGGRGLGSWDRTIRAAVTMFKTFPVAAIEKPVARFVKGMDESGKFTTSGFVGLAKMFTTLTALGYISMAAKDLAKGIEPRDPKDPKTWMAAFVQGGGAGLIGDFLFGETNRFGGGIVSTLAGPVAGDIGRLHDLYRRALDGDDTAATAFKFVLSNTPGNNIWYTKAAMDYLIMNEIQEHLNPGYLRRMEKRLEKNNEQQFFLPPSQQ
jgi:hypothetical protein